MLTYQEVTCFKIDYKDFDRFIKEEYGQPFEFAADVESGNDVWYSWDIKKRPLSIWELGEVEKFKSGRNPGYMAITLLQDLVNRDRIPEGRYLIQVSW